MVVVDQSRWRLVVTDNLGSSTYAGSGQILNTSQKQFSYHLNSGRTFQFTMNIDNPAASFMLNPPSTGMIPLLKVYRQTKVSRAWQLLLVGDIIHAEESGQGDVGLLTVVAADPWWRLQRRLLGIGWTSAYTGVSQGQPYQLGDAKNMLDYSYILQNVLSSTDAVWPTGLIIPGGPPPDPSTTATLQLTGNSSYIGPTYAQNVGDLVQQLCAVLGGPEVEIAPMEPQVQFLAYQPPYTGGTYYANIGRFNIYKAIGSSQNNTVFEYGTGSHNVATYDRVLSLDGLCNVAFAPPQGYPDSVAAGDGVVQQSRLESVANRGLFMDLVQGDVASADLRGVLCSEYVTVRGQARQQIVFTPTVDCPLDYGVDYGVGDVVPARAFVSGGYRYDGTARIYGIEISVDDNDAETPALTLIPGG